MRHLGGIGMLVAIAFALRFWLLPSVGFGIYIHEVYRAVPVRVICFWTLIGTACVWFLVAAWTSVHRHS